MTEIFESPRKYQMSKESKFKKYEGPEVNFQISVANYLRLKGLEGKFHHSPNEGLMKPQYGAKRKAMGVSSGYPDIMIHVKNSNFNGFAIELKVGRNILSPQQKEWLKCLENANWKVLCSYSFDEVIYEVDEYLKF